MDMKPGYKQTEVGVIPEDWEVKQIQEVCGFIVPGRNKPRVFDGNIPWITTPDLEDGRAVNESRSSLRVSISEAKAVGSKIVPAGSVLMSCVGELGIVALTRCDIVINQQLHAFLPTAAINGLFLAYAIKIQSSYIDSVATKTALPYLNKDNCNSIPIPLPTLPEQHAIAAALSDVDALIAALDRLIAKKRDIKQAAMQELLTGKRRVPGFIGEWEIAEFGELTSPRKERIDPRLGEKPSLCIELEHIAPETGRLIGGTMPNELSSLKSVFYPEDVLFGKLRAYLRKYWIADRRGVCSTEIWIFSPNARIMSEYLFQIVRTDQFIEAASTAYGTHMPRSDWNVVRHHKIPLPLPEEQSAISSILSDMDAEIAALETRREKTRALKQGMMQELLTGRIRLV